MTPKVINCFPQCAGQSYRPSNGTEGMIFEEAFCANCIHEKWMHTQNDDDLKCDILSRAFLFETKEEGYPEEWQYNNEGWPVCTAWKKFDWGRDDDDNLIDPPEPPTDDPNQLVLPFIFDELEIKESELVNNIS